MVIILLLILFGFVLVLIFELQKEKKRNRVLQSFIAGIIRSISDYMSRTDDITIENLSKVSSRKLPIPYNEILANVSHEFSKDFWIKPFEKWIKRDRNIFYDDKYANDGFNMIYWDLYDHIVTEMKKDIDKEKENFKNS